MRIRMINALTGSLMYIEESKLYEYIAAGHKLAAKAEPESAPEPAAEPVPAPAPKRSRKKASAATK